VIDRVANECATRNPTPSVLTPIYKLKQDGIHNPNTVKALLKLNGDAIYFSRSAIPSQRDAAPEDWAKHADYWGHVGLYAYSRSVLLDWPNYRESEIENLEKLEQLRFIENGVTVGTIVIDEPLGEVNVPQDLDLAREIVGKSDQSSKLK
jgi:3-deoxy-manno-octulosonate cytidylyltransferase (CMP-KDO synthetase)